MSEKLVAAIGIILIIIAVVISSPKVKSSIQGRFKLPGFQPAQKLIPSPQPTPSSFNSLMETTTPPFPTEVATGQAPKTGIDLFSQVLIFSSSLSLGYFLLRKRK